MRRRLLALHLNVDSHWFSNLLICIDTYRLLFGDGDVLFCDVFSHMYFEGHGSCALSVLHSVVPDLLLSLGPGNVDKNVLVYVCVVNG